MTTNKTSNSESINKILADIFELKSPEINETRREQIRELIESTINGDKSKTHLAITANLSQDRKGVLVYILTNLRLIKIEIDEKDIQSSSYSLDKIVAVDRKLVDGERAEVTVAFPKNTFGLKYNQAEKNITEFFQNVDQARTKGSSSNG